MNRENEIIEVRIDEIIPNRFQPRLTFNEEELQELANSIKLHGIIQPLVLRRLGDKFEIIAGERRYKAAQMAGLTTVPAIIVNLNDHESAEVAVIENLQRKNLSSLEEAQSYKKIIDLENITQEQLAVRMGISQSAIANKLRLLTLSIPVKEALLNNRISERHARSLLSINNSDDQINMLNKIITERLTVKQTDDEINKLLGKTTISKDDTIENIKNNTADLVFEKPKNDIDMLLKPQEQVTNSVKTETKEEVAMTPFMEIEPEILDFGIDINEATKEEKQNPSFENNKLNVNNIVEESVPVTNNVESTEEVKEEKSISKVISLAREESNKLKDLGYDVETEEFDFSDMYQIVIKIKKD